MTVHPFALNNSALKTVVYKIWYSGIFLKTVEKIKVPFKSDSNKGTLYKEVSMVMIKSR